MQRNRWCERASAAGIAVLLACTLQQDGNPFGSAGSGPVTTTAAPAGGESSESSTSGDVEAEASSEAENSTGAVDSSTTMPATTDPSGDPDPTGIDTSGGADPTGAMPGTGGMYDRCLQPEECGPGTTACLQILDMDDMPVGGFCTHEGCGDPQSDCTAPGSGTAQPFCLPVMIGNVQDAVCALDCGGGEVCPDGTQCIPLEVAWVCA